MAAIHSYLDFSLLPEIDSEKSFVVDILHFSPTLGEKILEIVQGQDCDRLNVVTVTPENVDNVIEMRTEKS